MGNSISAIYDDECDWGDLCRRADISDVKWEVYSAQARHAQLGYTKFKYTGSMLKQYVQYQMCKSELDTNWQKTVEEYNNFIKLAKKFNI